MTSWLLLESRPAATRGPKTSCLVPVAISSLGVSVTLYLTSWTLLKVTHPPLHMGMDDGTPLPSPRTRTHTHTHILVIVLTLHSPQMVLLTPP